MRIESEDDLMRREYGARRELDLAAMRQAVSRRKLWILGPVLLCFVGAVVGVNLVKPRYIAEAKILIENQENYFTRPDRNERDTALLPDDEAVQSQVQLVTSRDIARDAIKILDLKGNPEFDPLANGLGTVGRILVLLGLERDPMRVPAEDRILASYYDKLSVYSVLKSRVLSVSFTSTDSDLAAKAANTVSDLYIDLQSSAKRDSARSAAQSLATLIADLKLKVAQADTKAQEYRAKNGLLVGSNNTSITSQQLTDISTQLAQARTSEADAQAKAKLLRDMIKANRISEVPDVANNDTIRRLSDQRSLLKAQIAQQAQTLLPGHPHMQELNAQLADLEGQLRIAADKTARTLENEAHIAASRVENLQAALDAQKQTANVAGADEVGLRAMEQQATLLKDQLEFNTQKYQEALARENAESTPADARVISRAVAPELPAFPKKGPMIAIFTLAGFVLSLGVVIGRELLSGRAFVNETAPAELPVQLADEGYEDEDGFDSMPLRPSHAPQSGPPLARASAESDVLTPQMDALLADIRGRRKTVGGSRVLVAGANAAVLVVPVALRLARALARQDRVILVDCGAEPGGLESELARQEMTGDRHAEGVSGLKNLLAGETTFAEVIHRDQSSRLHILPLGTGALPGEPEGFEMVSDALAETYDHVILAIPVPTEAGFAIQGGERVDLAILLAEASEPKEEVDASRAVLYGAGVPEVMALEPTLAHGQAVGARTAA